MKVLTEQLHEDDVISIDTKILTCDETFRFGKLLRAIREYLSITSIAAPDYQFLGGGIPCEVLSCIRNTQGWRTGKLRLSLEFIPDIPEVLIGEDEDIALGSPLDQIRQMNGDLAQFNTPDSL